MAPLGLGMMLIVATPAQPRGPVESVEPLELSADGGLVVDLDERTGRAEGDVVIRRSDLVVCCDRAEAKYGRSRLSEVRCEGRVVMHRRDGTTLTALRVVFDAAARRLVASGGVVVWRPGGRLEGDRVEYDLASDRVRVTGRGSTFRFSPGANDAAPASERPCPRPSPPPP